MWPLNACSTPPAENITSFFLLEMCKAGHCIALHVEANFPVVNLLAVKCKAPICVCVNACKVQSLCVNELPVARQKLQSEMDLTYSGLLKHLLYTYNTCIHARIYTYTQVYTRVLHSADWPVSIMIIGGRTKLKNRAAVTVEKCPAWKGSPQF